MLLLFLRKITSSSVETRSSTCASVANTREIEILNEGNKTLNRNILTVFKELILCKTKKLFVTKKKPLIEI